MALPWAAGPALAGDGRPNIVFIFADDQAYDTLDPNDDPQVITPHLDRLASEGAQFTHCFNMGSWSGAVCVASRTMLVTGKTLWRAHALSRTFRGLGQQEPEPREAFLRTTWPRRMKSQGYETYFTGKWHVGIRPEQLFDHVVNVRPGMPRDTRPVGYNRPVEGQPDEWDPADPRFRGFWEGGRHWSEVLADDAIAFLRDAGGKRDEGRPFFMYLAFNAPHDPRQSPQEFLDLYPLESVALPIPFLPSYPHNTSGLHPGLRDEALAVHPRTEHAVRVHRREYYAIITHLDRQIGRILKELEALGLREDTWIIYTADHGLAVGHHGLLGKQNMYDHSLRVPFLIAGPGARPGTRISEPVQLQDLMATCLDLAGDDEREGVEFESLLPLVREEREEEREKAVYGAYLETQRAIRADGWKLVLYPQLGVKRLYHHAADPHEEHDLAERPEQRERMRRLFARLLALQEEHGDGLDLASAYPGLAP